MFGHTRILKVHELRARHSLLLPYNEPDSRLRVFLYKGDDYMLLNRLIIYSILKDTKNYRLSKLIKRHIVKECVR